MTKQQQGLGFFGAINAAFEESWAEVRVNKARIFFSLFGVFIAVLSLATIIGAGSMMGQAIQEDTERSRGKEATISVYANSGTVPRADYMAEIDRLIERYDLTASTRTGYGNFLLQFPTGMQYAGVQLYDYEYGVTRKVLIKEGRWFSPADKNSLAPKLIINEWAWERLGSPDLATNPTVEMSGTNNGIATIIGVTPDAGWIQGPEVIMLYDHYTFSPWEKDLPEYQFWVKPELADQLIEILERDINLFLGDSVNEWGGVGAGVRRSDAFPYDNYDPVGMVTLAFSGISGLVLLIGGIGILNISMVTIKQRVREIGIRRSFGATKNRIFFTVLMESVVATFVAGLLGVILSIVILRNPYVMDMFITVPIIDSPPYPLEAVAIALGATLLVGALAGLIPAIYAVRAKVIDAIRL